jgi:hypothetical protein
LLTEFSNNNWVHSTTKHTPFFLDYGQHPWKGLGKTRKDIRNPAVKEFAKEIQDIWEEAATALWISNESMIHSHNKHIQPSQEYKPGDKVYLEATNITVACPTKKTHRKTTWTFHNH